VVINEKKAAVIREGSSGYKRKEVVVIREGE